MFSKNSPSKRKHNEFHDPDYPKQEYQTEGDDSQPGCSTTFSNKRQKSFHGNQTKDESQQENYLHKVRQVIEREFQREIVMKQQQLEEVNERLEKAKHLLDRLRYGIVCSYYKKQEIPLTTADVASLRGSNCLIEREYKGPQMTIHPSVKKLIGKKPKDLQDVLRTCPKRTAAQNAVHTIRSKSQAQKREERKLKQIIREQGIVIDHSKQNNTESDVNALLNAAAQNGLSSTNASTTTIIKQEKSIQESANKSLGKSLNASRLNNKVKHLIVVGNTSKYIGNELERDIKSHTKNLTYKWLVFVQSKESNQPIERFVKKVRFYLHQSYRPNDVVDIESPPFQVSRRGWGEFPLRVQLYFHPELHQKPVQLIHNIVLDQTLSGIQTLGSETLLEIWLRDVKSKNSLNSEIKDVIPKAKVKKTESPKKNTTNIITHSEDLVDENLLDFLNKIESSPCSISADIEKIQPTVVVNEHFGVKIKTPSPEKYKAFSPTQHKSPIKLPPLVETSINSEKSFGATLNIRSNYVVSAAQPANEQFRTPIYSSGYLTSKALTTLVSLPTNSSQVKFSKNSSEDTNNISQIPPLRPITPLPASAFTSTIQKSSITLTKDGKILMPSASVASAVHRTILPIVSSSSTTISTATTQTSQITLTNKLQSASVSSTQAAMIFNAPKQILQKKLVQLVDSTGKVKYIQMLVAANSASSSAQSLMNSSVAPKLVTMAPSLEGNSRATNTTQITNTVTSPLLKLPNGARLMPAMTTKPNIFKIVPESMQTKPKIITFSTTSNRTAHTNTITTVSTQQKLQYSVTTNAQTVGQITASSRTAVARPNNTTLPISNKLQKSDVNNTNATKNLVFQKEGKLYIIDPQQMKYKQQQKKQISLLKPQISLLKQQQQHTIKATATTPATQLQNNNSYPVPFACFGSKQQRINSINALQLMQMKRVLFEKQFLRQEFRNMRPAVEFLLRRLKLVVGKDSLVSDFPFVSHTLQEFQSLTAFKQRAYEWLRAKNIAKLLRNHKNLQYLNHSSKEIFWSTKEIATYARQYAYTPPIKSLPRPGDQQQEGENSSNNFMDLVKIELKQEHVLRYDTLTDNYKVCKWVDIMWQTLDDYEHQRDQLQIIDIDGIQEKDNKNSSTIEATSNKRSSQLNNSSLNTYLTHPPHLENECQLVSDICKDLNIKLELEELDTKVYQPSAQIVLAQCLHLFIEKVLRQSIAFKQGNSSTSVSPFVIESMSTLVPQDFIKALAFNGELDFLTNNNFASASLAECLDPSLKEENL